MKFPASEKEKEIIHESAQDLVQSLEVSARLAQELIDKLNENFLSIDKDYKKEFSDLAARVDVCMWKMNLQLYSMREHPERILHKPEKKFD